MNRIDEESRRKPEFTEAAVPIALHDGQDWYFAKPWTEIRPRMALGKPIGLWCHTTHGDEYDLAVEELREAKTDEGIIMGALTVGAYLLRKQYDLSDAELEELFVFTIGDEASLQMVRDICEVATGRSGPKAGSGGGC